MKIESREHLRLQIPKYFTGGNFHLLEGQREYHYIRANDVCLTGIGLDVPSALMQGSQVKIKYNSKDIKADLDGTVMWCERDDRIGLNKRSYKNFRVGIRLDVRKADENMLLFQSLSQELEAAQVAVRV